MLATLRKVGGMATKGFSVMLFAFLSALNFVQLLCYIPLCTGFHFEDATFLPYFDIGINIDNTLIHSVPIE